MNAGLRKKKQNMILKETLMLTNNGVSGKTIENVKKYRDTKCHNRTKKESNYHTTKFFTEHLLLIELKQTKK